MGFFTVLPGNNPEDDDILFYADDATADGNEVVLDLTTKRTSELSVILIETDTDENPANLTEESHVTSSPSISSGDRFMTMEQSTKRIYKCRKCGAFKKGHVCAIYSSTSSDDSSVMEQPSESSRTAANKANLTRLAQRVEGDNSNDPDWVAPRRIDTSATRTSPRLVARKRTVSTIVTETDEEVPPRKARKMYECRNCHVPLKGHKCPQKLINQQIRQLTEIPRVVLDRVDRK